MNSIIRRASSDITEPLRRFLEADLGSWLRVEEYREEGTMVVKAEVPGINPEKDVDITLVGNELQIDVRHEEKNEHKDKAGYRSEFRYGTFSRAVSLPGPVEEKDIKASYNDGVLEVRIPVPDQAEATTRKIPITRGTAAGAAGAGTGAGAPTAQP